MWNPTARVPHGRTGLHYGSDLTDAEWAIFAPFLPKPCDRGRHRRWRWREVLDAICCEQTARGALCSDSFPPCRTVYHWFGELRDSGGFEDPNHDLVQMDCVRVGREQMPSAAVMTVRA